MGKFSRDFKKFIARGNLIDLAVGIMVGGAFNSLVKSFVDDILNPFIGIFLGKTALDSWKLEFALPMASDGSEAQTVVVSYGKFIQSSIDFIILAFIIFLIVRMANSIRTKAEDPKNVEVPTPKDIALLTDVKELLASIDSRLKSSEK